MIIDAHNHLGYEDALQQQNPEELMRCMEEAGIDRAVVFPFGPSTQNYRKINEDFSQHLKNKRFIAFGRINQLSKDAVSEVERIQSLGLKGIKIHTGHAPVTQAQHVLRAIEKTDLPVIVHTGDAVNDSPEHLKKIRFSGRLILAHGGKRHANIVADLLRTNENYYTETSIISAYGVSRLAAQIPTERILMGSDSPFNHPGVELLKLRHLQKRTILSQEDVDYISGKNYLRAFPDTL